MHSKYRNFIWLLFILSLVLFVFLPIHSAFAADPTGVDGRILTPDKTGDVVNWIEVARYGNYSLIVRANFLNANNCGSFYYGKYEYQYLAFSTGSTVYTTSNLYMSLNNWFKGNANSTAENLPANARLRQFTMENTALTAIGTASTKAGLTNGFSIPTITQRGTGDNIAFAMSYSEAVNFISHTHFVRESNPQTQNSNDIARANWTKISIPAYDPASKLNMCGAWLRSPGDTNNTVGILSNDRYLGGRVFQYHVNNGPQECGFAYPALWVSQGIFDTNTRTVTGFVSPMVANDRGLGDSFLRKHDVVVELRPTFRTPAAAELSTTAKLVNTSGLGQFTFENVPFGNYVLYIKRPGYLARAMLVTVSAADTPVKTLAPPGIADNNIFNLWWGDCNGSGRVDNEDILMIMEQMNLKVNALSPLYDPACDLNADRLVDNEDILMVMENWNKIAADYPGTEGVDFYR